ncbi:MAG TPA: hypothetical protein VIG99_21745 [Myxococcaceae bacterium]
MLEPLLAAAAACALAAASGCSPRPPAAAPSSVDAGTAMGTPRLELKGNLLSFDGRPLRFGDRLETWAAALGPPPAPGVQVVSAATADGRAYVSGLIVRLGEGQFPGAFVLQGVPLVRGGPPLKEVQRALLATDTPLVGVGRGPLPESAKMAVHGPDGFELAVAAHLDCRPPADGRDCEQVIDELEMSSTW